MAEESMILSGISTLRELGFFDFFLPFLLFFAVTYGILAKSNIFGSEGKERKDINAVVAFVIALIASTTSWVLLSLNYYLPWVGFLTIVILGFLILASFASGGDITSYLSQNAKYIVPLAGGVVFMIMFFALGWEKYVTQWNISNTDVALAIIGIVGIIIMYNLFKGNSVQTNNG